MVEVPLIDSCLPLRTNCKIFRSAEKLPELWEDSNGPLLKSISSVDGSTDFFYTTSTAWASKKGDPYRKKLDKKYSFYEDGYLWVPEHNPHYVNITGFFADDVALHEQECLDCEDKECIKFLDTKFMIPGWIEAEMMNKALELLLNSKRIQEDEQIDKNPNNKG